MKPITDAITRDHRTKLLTRRVRAIMRAFNKNPNYISLTPDITWDDSFIPPELYDDLETEPASPDAEESQQVQKEKEREKEKPKESKRLKMEVQMIKGKVKAMQNDKGKAKETAQDKGKPDDIENRKRKWTRTRKTPESNPAFGNTSSDNEDGTLDDEAEPPAKRVMRKKSIDGVGVIPVPPPCRRCTLSKIECKPKWLACSLPKLSKISTAMQSFQGSPTS